MDSLKALIVTYKLKPELRKTQFPVALVFPDGRRSQYRGETTVTNEAFEKKHMAASMKVIDGSIEIKLEESQVSDINWIGEEEVSFFYE